jgi:hypothetical protein
VNWLAEQFPLSLDIPTAKGAGRTCRASGHGLTNLTGCSSQDRGGCGQDKYKI